MEQDRASHVEGKRLSPLLRPQQIGHLAEKLQNGSPLPETVQAQVNGDIKWFHFKGSYGINHVKGNQENHASPDPVQNNIDYPKYIQNGGIKRTSSESSLLGLQQSKKNKQNEELNGLDSELLEKNNELHLPSLCNKKESVALEEEETVLSDLLKPSSFNFDSLESPNLQNRNQHKLGKNNFSYHNGDLLLHFKNKKVPIPNGATVPTSSMDNMHGDLLEKTLSQYYPDRVSIAMQKNTSHKHAINSQAFGELSHGTTHSSHTSGLTNSPQTSTSTLPQVPAAMAIDIHSSQNSRTSAVTGGCSYQFQECHQQQNHEQQVCNLQKLPVENNLHLQSSLGQVPNENILITSQSSLQKQNSTECFSNQPEANNVFFKKNSNFNEGSVVSTLESPRTLHIGVRDRLTPYQNINSEALSRAVASETSSNQTMPQSPSIVAQPENHQHKLSHPHEFQKQNLTENYGVNSTNAALELSPEEMKESSNQLMQALQASVSNELQQHYEQFQMQTQHQPLDEKQLQSHEKPRQSPFKSEANDLLQQSPHSHKQGWIELSSSRPQGDHSKTWKNTVLKSLLQLQQHQNEQIQCQKQEYIDSPNVSNGFQLQNFNQDQLCLLYKNELAHGQQQSRAEQQVQFQKHSPQVQHPKPEPQLQPYMQQHKAQQSHSQAGPTQHSQHAFTQQLQQQHLSQNTQETQQALQSQFVHQPLDKQLQETQLQQSQTQQQPQKSHQQALLQAINSIKLPQNLKQTQGNFELQCDGKSFNQLKLEEFVRLEKQYKMSNQFSSHTPQLQQEELHNPYNKNSPYKETSETTAMTSYNNMHFASEKTESTMNHELHTFNKQELQHMQYHPHSSAPKPQVQQDIQNLEQQKTSHMALIQGKQQLQQAPVLGGLNFKNSSPQATQMQQQRLVAASQQPPPVQQESQVSNQQTPLQNQKDFQKHAALRWHLLQKQEHQTYQQKVNSFNNLLQFIKSEESSQLQTSMPQQCALQKNKIWKTLKQESQKLSCENLQQKSIIEAMEQQLKQFQVSSLFEHQAFALKSPKNVKVETSGPVTILSTNIAGKDSSVSAPKSIPSFERTPTKKQSGSTLSSFLESPSNLFNTPIKNLLDTPVKTQYDFPPCGCVEQFSEKDEGPYYTHLGSGPTVAAVREMMENRFGQKGKAIRIEKVVYTGKEGKSSQGCPIAKWVIRRSSEEEKLLCLVRERASHSCETAVIIVLILIWEGIPISLADKLYAELTDTLRKYGAHTNRRCALNEERTCACQGLDPEACGASFSFGCSWSMYYNGCKFARSKAPRKFKLLGDDPKEEEKLESNMQHLATLIAPTYKKLAPDAYSNQIEYEHRASDCRLGLKEGRPFSGVTACLDFCAHSHRDLHNIQNGSTLVCTLTREDNREIGKIAEDEQLHVLPLYKISPTDEFGSTEAQEEMKRKGAIQVLNAFPRKVRMLAEPVKTCRQKKLEAKKAAAAAAAAVDKLSNHENGPSKGEKDKSTRQKQAISENGPQNKQIPDPSVAAGYIGTPGVQQHSLSSNHQLNPMNCYPSSPHPASPYLRFSNPTSLYQSPSYSTNSCPGSSNPLTTYPNSVHLGSPYLNSSNPVNPYTGPLTQTNPYSGYQCNGNIAMDNYSPYVSSFPSHSQHIDMYHYQSQDPLNKLGLPPIQTFYQQPLGSGQGYGPKYINYGNHNVQVSGYSNCSMRPNTLQMGSYPAYGTNHQVEAHFMEAASRSASSLSHPSLDFASLSKSNQYHPSQNPYVVQEHQSASGLFSNVPNTSHLQNQEADLNLLTINGISRMLPSLNHNRATLAQGGMAGAMGNNIQGNVSQLPIQNHEDAQEPAEVWSDSEHNFLDPEIGGVAVAPAHGSILIECAKRELHATTPLKNPNRNHPTRISLVFYQHKSMNEPKHGLALWEAKMAEKAREKEEESEKHGSDYVPNKSHNKKAKREPSESQDTSEPPYLRFVKSLAQRTMSITTNTSVTTSPYAFTRVTGPYNRYI
ncbi:methylcytosine dioxygenase TET2 [Latimeria chalumnae]|uniref:methylcytosine dioxygenase TET2 n=1 Tax=Latimeria chalumnae TaxID=7897 RepID=UPI0003C12E8F|nr:PREDICTED: methylcytosine dioxygenase TET2 [Latimeria chalumnae]|eukprot:XP_006005276.1 PREDICTED: methylcytosine dioxygenase TET2 [Latimeria chalumnae]